MSAIGNAIAPCPLCGMDLECRITVTTGDDPTGEAMLRMNLRVDEGPLRAHVKAEHSPAPAEFQAQP